MGQVREVAEVRQGRALAPSPRSRLDGASDGTSGETASRGHLAAISELGGTSMALLAVVDAARSKHDDPLWSVWHDSLQHFLVSPPRRSVTALPGVRWLHAAKAGHVLLADDQAMLKVVRFTKKSDPDQSPHVVFEHSLTSLTPTPRAAPPWAKAPLSPAR